MAAEPGGPPGRRPTIPLAVAPEALPARTSMRWLLAAPHRFFFFLGMLGLAAASLWWLAQIWARSLGAPPALALPPAWMHGWSMLNGFVPFFMFGFLFTAGPKWLNVQGPPARPLLAPGTLAFCGYLLALIGVQVTAALVVAGALVMAAGWTVLLARFFRLVRTSCADDRVHARLVLAFFAIGALAHLAFALGVARGSAAWIHAAQTLSIWFFIAPVYVTVAHRLIPFFTASVLPLLDSWRPLWLLTAFNGIAIAHGLLALAAAVYVPSTAIGALQLAVDGAGAALLFFVAWRWGMVQSLRNRLLAMLHLGFFWLGVALALHAWNDAVVLLDIGTASIGLAPLHALTMGFFGTVLLAMVTRVTAGHGGRKLVADDLIWSLFRILQAAVAVRVLVDAWPAQGRWLAPLAITLWCAALVPWAARNLPIYLRPRTDGRPG